MPSSGIGGGARGRSRAVRPSARHRLAEVEARIRKKRARRMSADRACASIPSAREMRAVASATSREPSRVMRCQDSGLRNLCTRARPNSDPRPWWGGCGSAPSPCRRRQRWFPRPGTASRSCAGSPATRRDPRPGPEGARSNAVGDFHRFLARRAEHDLAEVTPGGRGGIARRGRQRGDQLRHALHHRFGQRAVGGDQPAGLSCPCSICATRSTATSSASAVPSAITATSDGPAKTSMPTLP